jgi:hypothetical protein
LGNPPGKNKDPLGDEITWEQLLSRAGSASKLWIISKDSDYFAESGSQLYLNAFLYQELLGLNPNLEVVCFNRLANGIDDFSKALGIKVEEPLSPKEVEEFKKEQDGLPPAGWESLTGSTPGLVYPPGGTWPMFTDYYPARPRVITQVSATQPIVRRKRDPKD